MSEIKVDTLTGKTTANDITVTVGATATQSLEQGLAKMFAYITGDGTPVVTGSFNTSSLTDELASVVRANLTNPMNDLTFTNMGLPVEIGFKCFIQELTTGSYIRTTSSMVLKAHDTATARDIDGRHYIIFGDLA